ncbi:MAG: sulfatase [Planctomycetaceae bacterium]
MRVVSYCCLLALMVPAPAKAKQPDKLKNVVFILVDDLGWADLGCYGSMFHKTPNLDRFAASGMRFTNAYAACPVCSPTRAAIMTGQHPARVGITDWIPGQSPKNRKLLSNEDLNALPLNQVTMAEALKEHEFKTFFAGKWHLGSDGHLPEDQGFDINKGGHHKGSPPGGYYSPYKNPKLSDGPKGEYLPDRLTDESIEFLKSAKDSRFLLFLSYYTVHTPIQSDRKSIAQFKAASAKLESSPDRITEHKGETRSRQDRADYASMVFGMDRNIGRLLNALDELSLREDTAVIFTSDNGGLSTLAKGRNAPTCNLPLRAGKGWCYEGGVRVPLIIRAPGVTETESTSDTPVTSMDYYPTILNLLGLPSREDQHFDGIDLTSVLSGKPTVSRSALHWHYPHYHGSTWAPGAAIRAGQWKLIQFYDEPKTELYDLSTDPGEQTDLSKTHAAKSVELQTQLKEWQQRVGAKVPRVNPKFATNGN